MDEQELLYEIQRGNSNAYREMFDKYYSPLCEYASQFIPDADAEELVQDLMLYIWEEREHLVIGSSLKSYLFVAVKNRSFNAIRRQQYKKKVHSLLYEKLKEQFEDPDYYMVDELANKIQNAVNELPHNYRETFEMSRFGELTNAQIAAMLDISVKTVEYRITQSLKILRSKLNDYLYMLLLMM
ncbi:RNA polymerase sigma-70 factor [Prevotella sp. 10(H)]|uniref:RNA polymerase sigma-70 factor n=1 Tax=Prevotella sp. 10(H) TaxID=1158294 RepID=UPI0004A73F52|nr:RNA polymerase sigma-70 factor [Prevotella sp. 10(H)]